MDDPAITPRATRDPDLRWLMDQHQHDLEALELAADIIAANDVRIRQLEADQASLILQSRRLEAR